MKTQTSTIAQGQLGVHRVVAELIDRGHRPYLPVIDEGIDILLRSGIRLQVKTTRGATQHWRQAGQFLFTLAKAQVIRKRQYVPGQPRQFSDVCDFVVLWAIEPNRFWVVPAETLNGRWTVSISDTQKQWREIDEVHVNQLRAEGYSLAAIAEKFGTSVKTVQRRLTTFKKPRRQFTDMPQFENRWDLITGAHDTLREANQIVTQTGDSPPNEQPVEGPGVSRILKD